MDTISLAPVFVKLAAMFGISALGWLLRRRDWLRPGDTNLLSRITIDIAFPCLTFDQMLRTIDRAALAESLPVVLLGVMLLVLSLAVGAVWGRAHRGGADGGRSLGFVIGMPNWIFLPLPLAAALAGDLGVRTVLLLNVPAQILLWTLALAVLRGSIRDAHGFAELARNPGLIATALAVGLALAFPASTRWALGASVPGAVLQTVGLLGALTIPLSLLVTGAQLAESRIDARLRGLLVHVLAGRLVVAPLVTILAMEITGRWLGVDPIVRAVCHLVTAMPVAVSCGVFTERFGGDRELAANGILVTTVASLATIPLLLPFVRWLVSVG